MPIPQARRTSTATRLLAAALPLLVLLAIAEVGLRAYHSTLPSLAALDRGRDGSLTTAELGGGMTCSFHPLPSPGPRSDELLVVGDSVAAGNGVRPGEAFPDLLAAQIPSLQLQVVAAPGANICQSVQVLHYQLSNRPWPRAVLWELFGDDLISPILFSRQGERWADPSQEPSRPLRWLALRSYLGNLAWYRLRVSPAGAAAAAVSVQQHRELEQWLIGLQGATKRAGVVLLPVLLEPVGMARCPPSTAQRSPCSWMARDLRQLETWFRQAGTDPLDLRGLWEGAGDLTIPTEAAVTPPQRMPIHPNAQGHRILAEAILPELEARLAATP